MISSAICFIIIIIIIMAEVWVILRGLDTSNEGDTYGLLIIASPRGLNSKRILSFTINGIFGGENLVSCLVRWKTPPICCSIWYYIKQCLTASLRLFQTSDLHILARTSLRMGHVQYMECRTKQGCVIDWYRSRKKNRDLIQFFNSIYTKEVVIQKYIYYTRKC